MAGLLRDVHCIEGMDWSRGEGALRVAGSAGQPTGSRV